MSCLLLSLGLGAGEVSIVLCRVALWEGELAGEARSR